jgi:hypothetical protein
VFAFHVVLAQRHRQHRIAPQFIVVIEILIAQCQAEHALPDQVQQGVLDQVGAAVVLEASGEAAGCRFVVPVASTTKPRHRR